MREMLFRGRRLYGKEWVYSTTIFTEGDRVYMPRPDTNYIITSHADIVGDIWQIECKRPDCFYRVDPSTVGQYTGLTDKNGNKIFEGDILSIAQNSDGMGQYYYPPIPYPAHVVVKWDLCSWMWEVIGEDKYYLSFPDAWCHYDCEVIGNIHDNPELL